MRHISTALLAWCILVVVFLVASLMHVYAVGFLTAMLLAPLTLFLLVRGVLRWMGKQWRHSSSQQG
jgi:hypothetical protein